MSSAEDNDCPICMEKIDLKKNYVKTECGHNFHTNCLMQNVLRNGVNRNGFKCPYCRTDMATSDATSSVSSRTSSIPSRARNTGWRMYEDAMEISETSDANPSANVSSRAEENPVGPRRSQRIATRPRVTYTEPSTDDSTELEDFVREMSREIKARREAERKESLRETGLSEEEWLQAHRQAVLRESEFSEERKRRESEQVLIISEEEKERREKEHTDEMMAMMYQAQLQKIETQTTSQNVSNQEIDPFLLMMMMENDVANDVKMQSD
jgi:hypothetical protein